MRPLLRSVGPDPRERPHAEIFEDLNFALLFGEDPGHADPARQRLTNAVPPAQSLASPLRIDDRDRGFPGGGKDSRIPARPDVAGEGLDSDDREARFRSESSDPGRERIDVRAQEECERVTFLMRTGAFGLSRESRGAAAILSATSIPETTSPKAVY